MGQKTQKVKKHIKDNRKVYIAAGVGLVVGGVAVYILGQNDGITSNISLTRILSPGDNHVNVELSYLGHPGDAFQCLEDGTVYMSRGAIARALGVSRQAVTKYMNGDIPNLAGKTFKQLTDRGVPIAE